MIAFLIPYIIRASGSRLTARAARWVVYAALAVLVVALVALWLSRRDARMIERHNTAAQVEVLETTGSANENAAVSRRVDDAARAKESATLEKVIDNAPPPVAPISTARARYYECLRLTRSGKDCPSTASGPGLPR